MQRYNTKEIKLVSYQEFILSGRRNTIKKRILTYLLQQGQPFTAYELSQNLSVLRQSVTEPLKTLVDKGCLSIVSTKLDKNTRREVSLYSATKRPLN